MTPLTTSVPANSSYEPGVQDSTDSQCYPESWITTVVPVYIIIITVLGVVFNVFVLMVFCLHKKSCTIAEIYLSNLAAADLILTACLPFWAVNISKGFKWPFGWFLCKAVSQGIYMNACCSTFFLVLVSIDRYLALVHAMSQSRLRRRFYAKVCCVVVWLLGYLISLPIFIYRKEGPYCNAKYCTLTYPNKTAELISEWMLTVFSFIIPIVIISYCTFKIIQVLKNRPNRDKQSTEHKATILVLAVLLAFMICWLPFHVTRTLELFNVVDQDILGKCFQFVVYFAFFNSALNPVLYVIVGKNFRKRALELFMQWKHGGISSSTSTRSNLTRSIKSTDVSN